MGVEVEVSEVVVGVGDAGGGVECVGFVGFVSVIGCNGRLC